MSNELSTTVTPAKTDTALAKVLLMWQDASQLKTIKQIYAPKLSENEFTAFVQMGIALGLNPFLREIWAIKYDEKVGAQIFIGRDGYRKLISRNHNYNGHTAQAVYSNDEFHVDLVNVQVKHIMNLKDRGKLMGAYSIVYMKNIEKPYYVWVNFDEYNLKRSVWNEKPASMIAKVAECQAIRMADQSCCGTYSDDEVPDRMLSDYPDSKAAKLNKEMKLGKTYEHEKINQETGEVTTDETDKTPVAEAPMFTFEQVKTKIETATNIDILTEGASLVSDLEISAEERALLSKLYREKLKELKEAQ
jgi:phage recombination protein Bet